MTERISLITFNAFPLLQFNFAFIIKNHLTLLENLTCNSVETALFDSIDSCVDQMDKRKNILSDQLSCVYFVILIDGGNNFDRTEQQRAVLIQ